jgi:hypothetical protein
LAAKSAAINNPRIAWAVQPFFATTGLTNTILYHETTPRLFSFRQALKDRGIACDLITPLPCLARGLTGFDPNNPAICVFHTLERTLILHGNKSGVLELTSVPSDLARVEEAIAGITALYDPATPPFFSSCAIDQSLFTNRNSRFAHTPISLSDLFQAFTNHKSDDRQNFVAPPRGLHLDLPCYAVAACFSLVFLCSAGFYLASYISLSRSNEFARASEDRLTKDIATSRANKKRYEDATAILDELKHPAPTRAKFLDALGTCRQTYARPVTVRSINIQDATWTISGVLHEGVGSEKSSLHSLMQHFLENNPWSCDANQLPATFPSQDFTISGKFSQ